MINADRVQKQLSTQIRLANEQLEAYRLKSKNATAELKNHVCTSHQDVNELRTQHNNECKGLLVQIKYLKAKFTRESIFRADLGYQKGYLLAVLSKLEKGEKQILAALACNDYPLYQKQPPARKRPTLRTVAAVVLFISKARHASEFWREQSASRPAVIMALQDVRRRRVAQSLGEMK